MNSIQKIKQELETIIVLTAYFGLWLGGLVLLKYLLLAEYQIGFNDFSVAVIGGLVLAKVVLILEHVPFGSWVQKHPAWVDVLLRTLLYSVGVFLVLLLEKAFQGRHEHGGIYASVISVFEQADMLHVWLNSICLSGALLSYNVISVVRKHLGKGALLRMFLTPLPKDPKA